MKKLTLVSYNIWEQKLREADILIDIEKQSITTPSGKVYKIVNDYGYTYKIGRNEIKSANGIEGLVKFLNEINTPDSPFNPSRTNIFINL
jgi:hypothetical protein